VRISIWIRSTESSKYPAYVKTFRYVRERSHYL
jgi:hypothetical protein